MQFFKSDGDPRATMLCHLIRCKEEVLHSEGGKALKWVAQRGCPIPGSVLGQLGWDSEHPALVKGVHAQGRGLDLEDL